MNAIAKIVMDGTTQVIRLPEDIHLDGQEAIVRQDGNRLIVEVVASTPESRVADLHDWFAKLDEFRDSPFMPEGRDQPPMPPQEAFFNT